MRSHHIYPSREHSHRMLVCSLRMSGRTLLVSFLRRNIREGCWSVHCECQVGHYRYLSTEHSQRMLVCSMRTFAFMGSHHENPSTEHSQLMLVCSMRMFFRRRMFVLERLRRTCACAKNGPVQLPRCEGTDGLTSTLHRERSHHEPLTCESCRSPSHVVPSNAFYG